MNTSEKNNQEEGRYQIYRYISIKIRSKQKYTGCPKKMYTHKVNIPYYNVYTSFWDTLYFDE
jgi:hypothetical protein